MSLKLHEKFKAFVDKWNEENVTTEFSKVCDDWLLGRSGDLKDCATYRDEVDKPELSPYYPYNRYTTEYYKPDNPEDTTDPAVNGAKSQW